MDIRERAKVLASVQEALAKGDMTVGMAIQTLRKTITGLDQAHFAAMCKLSPRALRQLEHDESNPTVRTLNSVFKPFGMQVGIVPVRKPRR